MLSPAGFAAGDAPKREAKASEPAPEAVPELDRDGGALVGGTSAGE